jgi:hypothetical protein
MEEEIHMLHIERAKEPDSRREEGAGLRRLATITLGHRHNSLREGISLGLVVATCTWAWLLLVDAIAGQPFRTFTALGGIFGFTVVHTVLNVAYGLALVSIIHGAVREPNLMFALGFGFIMMEFAFAMATVMFSHVLGNIAWILIFGGSVFGATIAIVLLTRTHPLLAHLRRAEEGK